MIRDQMCHIKEGGQVMNHQVSKLNLSHIPHHYHLHPYHCRNLVTRLLITLGLGFKHHCSDSGSKVLREEAHELATMFLSFDHILEFLS